MDTKNIINLDEYRQLVRWYIDVHMYSAALFWADKVVSLSNEEPKDIYNLAQCMYLMKQYHRAAHLIRSKGLEKTDLMCHYLAVKSLLEAKEYSEALQIINECEGGGGGGGGGLGGCGVGNATQTITCMEHTNLWQDAPKNIASSILHVKGRVYEATDNRSVATDCYKQALNCDVYAYQAFEALVQNQMLSAAEERELLDSLPFNEQCCSEADQELIKLLYESKLKKYQEKYQDEDMSIITYGMKDILVTERLSENLDMQVAKAERLYYNCDYQQCFSLTEKILKKDPYHSACLPVHIACLVELKKTNALFYLAHKLVDQYPEMALAWFAVGCYYYSIGKSDHARRYLAKATALDRLFGPAWLAYGHSFAVENEHDQAMAAYFKASQLMKGCHLPLLYIGLECGLTNNLKLADKFFQQAQSIAPNDPFVIHETGVVSFLNSDFKMAEKQFKEALKRIQNGLKDVILPSKWEALLNNLGHTCRKLKKYDEALDYHLQALVLNPLNPSTYSAVGFIHALVGNLQEAADAFHRALGLRRDDTFTTTMLGYVLEQLIDESPPFPNAPAIIPKYNSSGNKSCTTTTTTTAAATDDEDSTNTGKLRVNLFSTWNEASEETINKSSSDVVDTSSVEMLDSSTAHIEY